MIPRDLRSWILLPTFALLLAGISNTLASPARRLSWLGRPLEAPQALPLPAEPIPTTPVAPESRPPAGSHPTPAKPRAVAEPASAVQPNSGTPEQPPPQGPLREAHPEAVHALFRAGARFLDARRSSDFQAGHIQGAWTLPVWEADLESRITAFEAEAAPNFQDPLVIYCGGGDCQDSHLLAQKFLSLGYRNLVIYRDGLPDWIRRGLPVTKGAGR